MQGAQRHQDTKAQRKAANKESLIAAFVCALVSWCLCAPSPLHAAEHRDVGLTPSGVRIEAVIVPGPASGSPTVLLVGGLTGTDESVRIVKNEVLKFEAVRQDRRKFQLIAIPLANPDANG